MYNVKGWRSETKNCIQMPLGTVCCDAVTSHIYFSQRFHLYVLTSHMPVIRQDDIISTCWSVSCCVIALTLLSFSNSLCLWLLFSYYWILKIWDLLITIYVGQSFNSGTDFFVSEWVDLLASWSCLLQNSVPVLLCTYSSAPATDVSTSGSHFL